MIPPSPPPSVYNSMIVTFYNDDGIMNYILNLDSISIEHCEGNQAIIRLLNTPTRKEWAEHPPGVGIVITDDPNLNHAGDWMNMGCSRIVFILNGPVKLKEKIFAYKGELVNKNIIIPERIPENENHPANLYI
jgi:hypothetical protein